jgi:RHS repeat-associated protein
LSKADTVTGQQTDYTYDALRNLTAVSLPDGRQIEYVVDGLDRRVGVKVNGTLVQAFLYDGQRIVAELDGSNSVVSRFVYGSRSNVPDYMILGGVTYRLITDHLGSVRLVVNTATGEVVQLLGYDEFGNVLRDTNPGFQPFGFAGGLYDRYTGLVRFGASDYDPQVGRWTAKDPIAFAGMSTNAYAYCYNDPVNWLDFSGTEPAAFTNVVFGPGGAVQPADQAPMVQWVAKGPRPHWEFDPLATTRRSASVSGIIEAAPSAGPGGSCPEVPNVPKVISTIGTIASGVGRIAGELLMYNPLITAILATLFPPPQEAVEQAIQEIERQTGFPGVKPWRSAAERFLYEGA